MPYTQHEWVLGEVITEALLDHLETQYDEAVTYVDSFNHVPQGAIIMWHGTIGNIPAGWVICDGNNGTPNLLAKFVQGVATAGTNPGDTGGSVNHSHATPLAANMQSGGGDNYKVANTDASDGRPPFYDIAFIMKT